MEIASRTPEGTPNRCPVCGNEVKIEPSVPAGDAPCPHCGTLLWFVSTEDGLLTFSTLAVHVRSSESPGKGTQAPRIEHEWAPGGQPIQAGDRVRIIDGTFENYEGRIEHVDLVAGRVSVLIDIFGRITPVELELFQVERLPD